MSSLQKIDHQIEEVQAKVIDLEKKRNDALAFMDACDQFGVSAILEFFRSGNGAHVRIFSPKAFVRI